MTTSAGMQSLSTLNPELLQGFPRRRRRSWWQDLIRLMFGR